MPRGRKNSGLQQLTQKRRELEVRRGRAIAFRLVAAGLSFYRRSSAALISHRHRRDQAPPPCSPSAMVAGGIKVSSSAMVADGIKVSSSAVLASRRRSSSAVLDWSCSAADSTSAAADSTSSAAESTSAATVSPARAAVAAAPAASPAFPLLGLRQSQAKARIFPAPSLHLPGSA
ncbi:unnamed protein product [Urochloa humidicola]